eukprot:5052185-Amphidinium_carterae.1
MALQYAAESCRSDHEIVLAAVRQDGFALHFAAESCKNDREIVLAAVQQNGCALEDAAESCRSDRGIVLAAVQNHIIGLLFASDALLEDTSFAADAKKEVYILRISLMSGRSTCVPAIQDEVTETVIDWACERLALPRSGSERLLQGTSVVPAGTFLQDWPGSLRLGEVTDYQLIV